MPHQGNPRGRIRLEINCLLIAALLLPPAVAHAQGGRASAVVVHELALEKIEERRLVTGELRSLRRSRVASLEGGRVVELPVSEGDVVEAGDLLARLDDVRLRLELARSEAELAVAVASRAEREALLEQARRDEANLENLLARSSAARQEYEDAVTTRLAAQARLEQAIAQIRYTESEIELLRERLDDTSIRAPFRASIVRKVADIGDWIGVGDPVVEVIDCDHMEAHLAVPERYTGALLREELFIPMQLRALGKPLAASKPRVVRQVDSSARTLSLIVPVESPAGELLAPGMSVIAWIPTGREGEYLVMPRDALLQNPAGDFVYVVVDTGDGEVADARQIRVAFELDGAVAVAPGSLSAGDRVVVEGNERLFPFAPVHVVRIGDEGEVMSAEQGEADVGENGEAGNEAEYSDANRSGDGGTR